MMRRKKYIAQNAVARLMSSHFIHITVGLLITINAFVIAAKTFYSSGDEIYQLLSKIDNILLYIFVVEIGVRLLANGSGFFKRYWNIFDFIVIFGSLIPFTGSLTILQSLRVLRLFYLIEISKKMQHILHGLYLALPGIGNVVMLLVIVFFTYSLIGANLYKHPGVDAFQNFAVAAQTMFQVLTGDDWTAHFQAVSKEFPYAWVFFYSFYIVMSFILLNLFIGVVVGALQNAEAEIEAEYSQDIAEQIDPVTAELKAIKAELAAIKKAILIKNVNE